MNRKLKKLLKVAKDEWVFRVDLMLDDFKELQERMNKIEQKVNTNVLILEIMKSKGVGN